MEKDRNEELQSRREFFKKAAKSTLPVIAAVALASVPTLAKASEAMGCKYGCNGSCQGCRGGCTGCSGCGSYCRMNCSSGCAHNLR